MPSGSLGIADLDARMSWAYVMNGMSNGMSPGTIGYQRAAPLLAALYAAL